MKWQKQQNVYSAINTPFAQVNILRGFVCFYITLQLQGYKFKYWCLRVTALDEEWKYPYIVLLDFTYSRDSGLVQTCKGRRPSSETALALAPCISKSLAHSGWQFSQASCSAVVPPGARSTSAPRCSRSLRQSAKPRPAVMWSGVVSSCS